MCIIMPSYRVFRHSTWAFSFFFKGAIYKIISPPDIVVVRCMKTNQRRCSSLEESHIHEHECSANLAKKQEAGEQHTQCDVTFYCKCHDATGSVQRKFFLKSNKLHFVYSSFKSSFHLQICLISLFMFYSFLVQYEFFLSCGQLVYLKKKILKAAAVHLSD